MLYIKIENHDFHYAVSHLLKTFYKDDELKIIDNKVWNAEVLVNNQDFFLVNRITESEKGYKIQLEIHHKGLMTEAFESEGVKVSDDVHVEKRNKKEINGRAIYLFMSDLKQQKNDWGILVGVRPVKLVHEMFDKGMVFDEIFHVMTNRYMLSEAKARLIIGIATKERVLIFPVNKNALSIYICIPFCPTTCVYCSFPSNSLVKKGKLVEAYLDCLIKEITKVNEKIKSSDYFVDCIYIGGGTPTALTEPQFRRLLECVEANFDLEQLKEFTVEAGRPDTITEDKLKLFREYGVDRICVNPQSMNDKTLKVIGRSHSVQDIEDVMVMARAVGFETINMDLIAGLPGEDWQDFNVTMDAIKRLNPENVTVHTLAVKSSSRLKHEIEDYVLSQKQQVEKMLELSRETMIAMDSAPYYMYRQKNMLGNFENVGYGKSGHESLYNMRIMEERNHIMAFGAGSVSKLCFAEENRFERVANPKGLEDYIDRIDKVIGDKDMFFSVD